MSSWLKAEKPEEWQEKILLAPDSDSWRHQEMKVGDKKIVISPAGAFLLSEENFFRTLRPAKIKDLRQLLPVQDPGQGAVQLAGRLPLELISKAASFFKEAYAIAHCEEILLIYYLIDTGEYELHHPKIISAASDHVEYEAPPTPTQALRFGDIHSHCYVSAHHSSRDKKDDVLSPGVHIIIGDVDGPLPSLHCVCSDGDECFAVSPLDVIEFPPWPPVPASWLADLRQSRP